MKAKHSVVQKACAVLPLVLIVITVFSAKAFAEEKSPSVGLDLNLGSKYVWRGLVVTDDPVLQPSLTVGYRKFSLNFWANQDLTDKGASGGSDITEFDYTLDYSTSVDAFSVSLGVIQYTFPNTGAEGTTEIYGVIGYDFPVAPTLSLYWDADEAGGIYGTFALGYSFGLPEFSGISSSLDLSGSIAYASSGWNELYYGVDDSALVDLLVTASWSVPVDDHFSAGAYVSYSQLVDSTLRDAVNSRGSNVDPVFYGVTISFAF